MDTEPPLHDRLESAWARRCEALDAAQGVRTAMLREVFEELESVAEELEAHGNPIVRAHALHLSAHVATDLGSFEDAERRWEAAVRILRTEGDDAQLAHKVRHLGDAVRARGSLREARGHYEEALTLYRGLDGVDLGALANALRRMADIEERLGATKRARDLWEEARSMYERLGVEAGVHEADRHLTKLGKRKK